MNEKHEWSYKNFKVLQVMPTNGTLAIFANIEEGKNRALRAANGCREPLQLLTQRPSVSCVHVVLKVLNKQSPNIRTVIKPLHCSSARGDVSGVIETIHHAAPTQNESIASFGRRTTTVQSN